MANEIEFDWGTANLSHIAEHGVTPEEFGLSPLFMQTGGTQECTWSDGGTEMASRRMVPRFKTEKEEADWWYRNRDKIARDFELAAKKGELKPLDKATLRARLASRVITIRLPEEDIELARQQASKKGLPYQTYIKSLLHQVLRQTR